MIIQRVQWFNFISSSFYKRKQKSSDGRFKNNNKKKAEQTNKKKVYLSFFLIAEKQEVKFLEQIYFITDVSSWYRHILSRAIAREPLTFKLLVLGESNKLLLVKRD